MKIYQLQKFLDDNVLFKLTSSFADFPLPDVAVVDHIKMHRYS